MISGIILPNVTHSIRYLYMLAHSYKNSYEFEPVWLCMLGGQGHGECVLVV